MKPLMDKRKHESNGSNTELGSQETRAVLPDLATDSSWETVRNSLVPKLLLLLVWGPLFLRLWPFWALRPELLNAKAASSGGCEHYGLQEFFKVGAGTWVYSIEQRGLRICTCKVQDTRIFNKVFLLFFPFFFFKKKSIRWNVHNTGQQKKRKLWHSVKQVSVWG